jgi:integral membrane protein (TIGR01906 family)
MLLSTIEYVVFDTENYQKEYAKLGVETETGLDHEDLLRVTQGLLDYLHGIRDELNIKANISGMSQEVFTQRETAHMVDVRDLLNKGYELRKISFFGSLIAFLGLCLTARGRSLRFLTRGILAGVCLFVIILTCIGLFMLQDFEVYWNRIHEVIFSNDLWLLDPAESILIRMVPEQFFFDMIKRIMLIFSSFLVIITVPSILYVYRKK